MSNTLRTLAVPSGDAVAEILPVLREVLAGNTSAVLPVPAGDLRETARLERALASGERIEDGVALVVATSGTTGTPKGAMLSAAALRASGSATHERLGGAGSWLLALPTHHIAGLQVLFRGILAGLPPVVLDVSDGFDPAALAPAIDAMPGPRRYTSLVPTQLVKALDDAAGVAALTRLDAVLLGGAATPVWLREKATDAGITLFRTYGMSETCGGCVYNGVALDGALVEIEDGRVVLGGPMVATGYRGLPEHPSFARQGWFRTDDAGTVSDGILTVTGRLDEAISTGGLTVVPQVVEAAILSHPDVRECAIVGVADRRLGERVVVAVVAAPGATPTLGNIRDHVAQELDSTAAPRELLVVEALPLRGPGKVDRAAVRALFGQ
ncbi:o-succinylbenzoate--CoA ligase [Antrihabitans spumae]|uniref:O-succinylbenzoate--CoA ligase n=1 Tax=Antrihabitans spumae TaxID=3373370 RepID=A0ABW7KDD9_9NOCA